jgi:anti-sigma regulatory factor (Ser/Thr protein kinase)
MTGARALPDTITVIIPSNPKYLRAVRSMLDEVTYEMGFSAKARSEVIHAVDEACTNVIKHGYGGNADKKIVLILRERLDRLEVTIKDFGKKVHPARIRSRELHDVKPGGLGVYFIRRSMDMVWYDTSPRVGTELKMVKYLKKQRHR